MSASESAEPGAGCAAALRAGFRIPPRASAEHWKLKGETMKKTPEELAKKRAFAKRLAWRELEHPANLCAPTWWMTDEALEAYAPEKVTLAEIRRAVRLANAAPELLAALQDLVFATAKVEGGIAASARANARAAILKAGGDL